MRYIKLYDYFRKIYWPDVAQWLIVGGIFTERYFELGILLLVALVNIGVYRQFAGGLKVMLLMGVVLCASIITLTVYRYSPEKFVQQFILLFLTLTLYHSFYYLNVKHIKSLFDKYLYAAFLVALLGLVQAVVYFATQYNIFGFLYERENFTVIPRVLRVTSIIDEPSNLSTLLTPAIAYYFLNDRQDYPRSRFRQMVIYLCTFLTFSSITYFVFAFMLVYKYLIYKRYFWAKLLALGVIVLGIGGFILLLSAEKASDKGMFSDIAMKVRETSTTIVHMNVESFDDLNMSSYATLTNLWVAMHAPGRIIGTGLGTHEQNYYKTYHSESAFYGVNAAEGYSLFNRLLSEFGVIGVLVIICFLGWLYDKNSVINVAVMFIILTLFIRGGHYTRYGTIFFFYLYFYTSVIGRKLKSKI